MSLLGDIKDVGSAVFEVGKAAKGLISNADKLADGLKGLGSLFQRFSTAGRLSDLARLGGSLSAYGDDALRFLANPEITRFLKRAKTPILVGGQVTIAGMKLTTGFGRPDDGERFGAGAGRFRRAGETLAGAYPNGSWTGSGSESYSDSNSRQVGRTQAMATQDQSITAVLTREASQITATRNVLDQQSDWLADVGVVTMLVAATPFVGQGASLAMEIAAVTKALGACTLRLNELVQQVNGNAAEIQQTVGRYGGVSGRSNLTKRTPDPTTPAPSPPPAGESDEPSGETDSPTDERASDGTRSGTESSGESSGSGSASGGGPVSGSGGGSASGSGGAPSGDMPSGPGMPQMPAMPETITRASPAAAASPSPGGAGMSSPAPPLSSLPAAAAGAMPAAGTAGMSAAQIASLVRSAVQSAIQDQAERERAERETKDTDGDGILDLDEDENGDGIPDVEQDENDDGGPDAAGAAPGATKGGGAPVHFAVGVDPARDDQTGHSYFGSK